MNEDIQKMLRMAEQIRDETQVGENTAVRVGTEIYDIVVELNKMLAMMDDKLENDAVVRIIKSELAKITITEAQIADGAITAAKLADGSVKNRHLAIIISSLPTAFTGRINSSLSIRKSRQSRQVLLRVYPYLCAPNVSFPVGIHTT